MESVVTALLLIHLAVPGYIVLGVFWRRRTIGSRALHLRYE